MYGNFYQTIKKKGGMGSEGVSGEIAKTVRINLVIRDSSIILRYSASKMAGCIAIAIFFFGASRITNDNWK